jgi:hypothetical protein
MDQRRIFARDRRSAAVHEAGHVVVTRILDLEIMSAWIVPNDGDDTERTWAGRVQIANVRGAGDLARRMVGVAGSVAEHLWRSEWIEDYWPDEEMSDSDWQLAGCEPGKPDDLFENAIQEVADLLVRDGPGWKMLVAESRRLIVASRSCGKPPLRTGPRRIRRVARWSCKQTEAR